MIPVGENLIKTRADIGVRCKKCGSGLILKKAYRSRFLSCSAPFRFMFTWDRQSVNSWLLSNFLATAPCPSSNNRNAHQFLIHFDTRQQTVTGHSEKTIMETHKQFRFGGLYYYETSDDNLRVSNTIFQNYFSLGPRERIIKQRAIDLKNSIEKQGSR